MDVLILSQFLSATRGGGEYVFSMITDHLSKNNHNVWIITNKIMNEKYLQHKNIKIKLRALIDNPSTSEYHFISIICYDGRCQ